MDDLHSALVVPSMEVHSVLPRCAVGDAPRTRVRLATPLHRPVVAALAAALLGASGAWADEGQVSYLAKQLKTSKDARIRVQTALVLGRTKSPDAVPVLCEALRDPEAVVRAAAASALGEVGAPAAIDCLKAALGEADPAVRAAMEKTLAALQPAAAPARGLYFRVDPVQDGVGDLPAALVELADKLLRETLAARGVTLAPPDEEKPAATTATTATRSKGPVGYRLKTRLVNGPKQGSLRLQILVVTWPELTVKGTCNEDALTGKPESRIKLLVPRAVNSVTALVESTE